MTNPNKSSLVTNEEIWAEWRSITRFLESTRLAFARERNLWNSLEITTPDDVTLTAPAGQGTYAVSLSNHIGAIGEERTLFGAVLIQSYALAESAVADRVTPGERSTGGIESWGGKVLNARSKDWSDVWGGVAGAVDVAVVRDAFAHGTRRIDDAAVRRLESAGSPPRSPGSAVPLTYGDLRAYRDRLRSLLRVGGFNIPGQPLENEASADADRERISTDRSRAALLGAVTYSAISRGWLHRGHAAVGTSNRARSGAYSCATGEFGDRENRGRGNDSLEMRCGMG